MTALGVFDIITNNTQKGVFLSSNLPSKNQIPHVPAGFTVYTSDQGLMVWIWNGYSWQTVNTAM